MKDNILIEKSLHFAARIIKLNKYLVKDKKETIISKQIIRSGTSIGANINEANYGQSKADFISKMQIFQHTMYCLTLINLKTIYLTKRLHYIKICHLSNLLPF